jgi:hypothetical protein
LYILGFDSALFCADDRVGWAISHQSSTTEHIHHACGA